MEKDNKIFETCQKMEFGNLPIEKNFDTLYKRGYRIVSVKIFPVNDIASKEPRGVLILRWRGKLYSSVLWLRFSDWLCSEPVRFYGSTP